MGFYNPRPESNFAVDIVIKWVVDIISVVFVALFLVTYMCDEETMVGSSMSKSLANEDSVIIDKIRYNIFSPDRFDIIAYKEKENSEDISIKRIIGLPGETIRISDSKIYIDGKQIEDKYFNGEFESGYVSEELVIGKDEYFVMGDNRNLSEDSRFSYVGNVSSKDIIGKVWFITGPFERIGFVD